MTEEFVLKNEGGLHARPAADFVQLCKGLTSKIQISKGNKTADAKSIISILGLAAGANTKISIEVVGDNEAADMNAIKDCLNRLA